MTKHKIRILGVKPFLQATERHLTVKRGKLNVGYVSAFGSAACYAVFVSSLNRNVHILERGSRSMHGRLDFT